MHPHGRDLIVLALANLHIEIPGAISFVARCAAACTISRPETYMDSDNTARVQKEKVARANWPTQSLARFYVYMFLRAVADEYGVARTPIYVGKGSSRRAYSESNRPVLLICGRRCAHLSLLIKHQCHCPWTLESGADRQNLLPRRRSGNTLQTEARRRSQAKLRYKARGTRPGCQPN